jgi:hypothetical protein
MLVERFCRSSGSRMVWRSGRVGVLTLIAALTGACYVYTPAPAAPATGSHLLLDLTDKGRVGLGDSIGPSASTIEGTTISSTDSSYSLLVSKVRYLNGQSNDWSGEPLLVDRNFVSRAREQRFSRGRTFLTGTAVGVAAIAFIATRGLLGFGTASSGSGHGPPNQD